MLLASVDDPREKFLEVGPTQMFNAKRMTGTDKYGLRLVPDVRVHEGYPALWKERVADQVYDFAEQVDPECDHFKVDELESVTLSIPF